MEPAGVVVSFLVFVSYFEEGRATGGGKDGDGQTSNQAISRSEMDLICTSYAKEYRAGCNGYYESLAPGSIDAPSDDFINRSPVMQ